jgi:hypothetical protein
MDNTFPDIDYLRSILKYDWQTGELTWLERPREHFATYRAYRQSNSRCAGKPAGHLHKRTGRIRITIDGRQYLAARLAFAIVAGRPPSNRIVHQDGNPGNSALTNLREVYRQEKGPGKTGAE